MKFSKFLSYIAVFAALTFSSCSEGEYWDEAPVTGDTYTFSQKTNAYEFAGAIPESVTVELMRNTTVGDVTIPVVAEFSDPTVMSGASEVTFANGSNKAQYVINLGDLQVAIDYTAKISLAQEELLATSGNMSCTVSFSVAYNWVSKGTGKFCDQFTLGSNFYDVEILQAEGFSRYRVVTPYNEGMAADDGQWEDWRTGNYPQHIEFWTAEDGVSIDFNPINLGLNYQAVKGQAIVAYPAYYLGADPSNTRWYNEQIAVISPYYYISGLGGWDYTGYVGVIQVILPQ